MLMVEVLLPEDPPLVPAPLLSVADDGLPEV